MNMKVFYDWLKEIESIRRDVLVSIRISDVCREAIEIRVDFLDIQEKKYFCYEVVEINKENMVDRNLLISLNRIKLFIRSKCLSNKK